MKIVNGIKNLFNEFKKFINRGNVMDLAVGMIIGSAFTAIVTSLVKYILTPLINWIPGANGTGALQTVLRPAVTDANGNIITDALILDWGAVISAIFTFFMTAIILFAIVKVFNGVKEGSEKIKAEAKKNKELLKKDKEYEKAVKKAKKKGLPIPKREEPVVEVAPVVAPEPPKPTTEELLTEIVSILKKEQNQETK